tara:strand:+ start:96 stop:1130 length:1035 start_codon:yes stop_codon:yes gene_type:complete
MGLFDFFKKKKTSAKTEQKTKSLEARRKEVKWFKPDEVGIIAKPKIDKSGRVLNSWYDLKGNRAYPTSAKRGRAFSVAAYLGLKQYKNSQRWELIKPEDVDPHMNNVAFLSKHALRSKQEIANELKSKKNEVKKIFDKDNNGLPDVAEGDVFSKILRKNQKRIIEVDKSHIKEFVKLGSFLEKERKKINELFKKISKCKSTDELENLKIVIELNVNFFQVCLVHSLNMIASLMDEDLITYHQIYETFDEMKVFNSNWQNDFLDGISELGLGIAMLRRDMNMMNEAILDEMYNIGNEIQSLSYNIDSFSDTVSSQLKSIDSGIQFNNLLGIVNTFQFRKMNKRLK